jgi:hypothetical protein
MDLQEIYNRVAEHLLQQGRRAMDEEGVCRYRAGELSCAIGCLIKDEFYSEDLEDTLASSGPVISALSQSLSCGVSGYDALFLLDLQSIHDNTAVKDWKYALEEFARERGLIPYEDSTASTPLTPSPKAS